MIKNSAKRLVRGLMVHAPPIQGARFKFELSMRRLLGAVHDNDWIAFKALKIPEGVVLDIGANRGQSIVSFKIVLPNVTIMAFEPNPVLAERLATQYANDETVDVVACALADAAGTMSLHIPKYHGWTFDGLASLDKEEAMNWLRPDRIAWYDKAKLTCVSYDVEINFIDTMNLSPAIIKLDTQGYELNVLKGAARTLEGCQPIVLLEDANEYITAFLSEFGYTPYAYRDKTFVGGEIGEKNTFYLKDMHLP